MQLAKGSAGAPPAAFGASPDASSRMAQAEQSAPSTFDASGGAPLAAGGAPALPFSRTDIDAPTESIRPYTPSSSRTICTPATMFASLRFAAQRAVWLSPQSGANARRSAGA